MTSRPRQQPASLVPAVRFEWPKIVAAIFAAIMVTYLVVVVAPFYINGIAGLPDRVIATPEYAASLMWPYNVPGAGPVLRMTGVFSMMFVPLFGTCLVLLSLLVMWRDSRRALLPRIIGLTWIVLGVVAVYFVISPTGRAVLLWFAD